ncbi:MAG: EFR1 family ferrodoxin [Lachnospiraceae bacterium]|nr:EFR1 family ferrodoxin [Lachnospiraceae bacterium]
MKQCPKCNNIDQSGTIRFCASCGTEMFFLSRFEKTDKNQSILTLFFSGTGNTKYIAQIFSEKIGAECHSIEEDLNFTDAIIKHETIAFCYPIYGSRVPLIMREFVGRYMEPLKGKKLAILVTQAMFSGDGARVLCDLFPKDYIDVVYAEHFLMPNNIGNFFVSAKSGQSIKKCLDKAVARVETVVQNMKHGIVKKRGFSTISILLGKVQGVSWQGDSKCPHALPKTMEYRAKRSVKFDSDCTACGACVLSCPMKNLKCENGVMSHMNNCTACYRCVNICPHRAITAFIKSKPKWQYKEFI